MNRCWIFLLLLPISTLSQKNTTKQSTLLGVRFNLFDFKTKSPFGKYSNSSPGLGFNMVKEINNHLDWSVNLDGAFADSVKEIKSTEKHLFIEVDFSIRARMFPLGNRVQPFLAGGVGISYYDQSFAVYAPIGTGVQLTLFRDAYILVHAHYRFTFPSTIKPHYFYSIGFAGTINTNNKKQAIQKPSPVKSVIRVPPSDRDGDGILDSIDVCPDKAGLAIFAGCPDRDEDGIPDINDRCVDIKGFPRYQGCPIPDTDGDGLDDEQDSCVTVAGIQLYHGCPPPDRDKDGVMDEEDKCPDVIGLLSNAGCPMIKDEVVRRIDIAARNILFKTNSYSLSTSSYAPLDSIIRILKEDTLIRMSIEGHTDNVGQPERNKILSELRAKEVLDYLVGKGIAANRLHYAGFGEERPLTGNTTTSGRMLNRRVELKLSYDPESD